MKNLIILLLVSFNLQAETHYCFCQQTEEGYSPYFVTVDDLGNYNSVLLDSIIYPNVYDCQYVLFQEPLCR